MPILYLDMDGVVADFNAYARKVLKNSHNKKDRWPESEWVKLRENSRLYRDLDKTPEADDLVKYCRNYANQHGYEVRFLTAIPRKNDIVFAFDDKVIWAQKYFPDIPVMFGPYSHDKQAHVSPGDILIDDRTSNIEEWRAMGGYGILHKGNLDKTIESLEKII